MGHEAAKKLLSNESFHSECDIFMVSCKKENPQKNKGIVALFKVTEGPLSQLLCLNRECELCTATPCCQGRLPQSNTVVRLAEGSQAFSGTSSSSFSSSGASPVKVTTAKGEFEG